jgi:hypothetical protein
VRAQRALRQHGAADRLSVFCLDGNFDPIASPTRNPGITGLQSVAAYCAALPSAGAKVTGALRGPTHIDVTANLNLRHRPAVSLLDPPGVEAAGASLQAQPVDRLVVRGAGLGVGLGFDAARGRAPDEVMAAKSGGRRAGDAPIELAAVIGNQRHAPISLAGLWRRFLR